MTDLHSYLSFIKEKGRPLLEINPGSDEMALTVMDALFGIELLKNKHDPILGGDVLSEDAEGLIYAYQLWGTEYHYLNWYCEKLGNEDEEEFAERSYDIAKESIINASRIAEKLNKKCFIVLVAK